MVLRENNCDLKLKNKQGLTVLEMAIKFNKQNCAQYLKQYFSL